MHSWRTALAALVADGFALVLAVVGLGTGMEPVPRHVELALFVIAAGMALATVPLVLGALQPRRGRWGMMERWFVVFVLLASAVLVVVVADVWWLAVVPLAGLLLLWMSPVLVQLGKEPFEYGPPMPVGTTFVITLALAAGLAVVVVQPQTASTATVQASTSAKLSIAIEHLATSGDPRKRALGDDLRSLTGALASAGISLAPAVLGGLALDAEGLAAGGALGAGGLLDLFGHLADGARKGVTLDPRLEVKPTIRFDPTFKLDPTFKFDPTFRNERIVKLYPTLNVARLTLTLLGAPQRPHRRCGRKLLPRTP